MKFTILIILLTTINIFSQTYTCNLALDESPKVRGLKIGMVKEDVEKIISPTKIKSATYLSKNELPKTENFKKVDSISLIMIPDYPDFKIFKLYEFTVKYDEDYVKWDSVQEFANNLSKNLNLPKDAWRIYSDRAEMKCPDFEIEVNITNTIKVKSIVLQKIIEQDKQKQKEEFKP